MASATPIRTEDLPSSYPSFSGRVLLISDTEFRKPNKLMDDITRVVRSGDTLLLVGDILALPSGSSDGPSAQKAWEMVSPFFERLKESEVRVFVILGNHDGSMETARKALTPVIGEYYQSGEVEKSFTFTNGDMAFICLSGRSQGDLDSGYLRRTLVDLESRGFKEITIVSHYPIDRIGQFSTTGPRIGSSLTEDRRLYEILSEFSLRLNLTVIGGHQHVAFLGDYSSFDGTIQVTDLHLPSPKVGYRYPNGVRSDRRYAIYHRDHFELLSLSGKPIKMPEEIKGIKGTFKNLETLANSGKALLH